MKNVKRYYSTRCYRWNRRTIEQPCLLDLVQRCPPWPPRLIFKRIRMGYIPLLGELVPLIGNLGGSGIWYYLIGLLIGVGAIVASLLSEVIVD